MNPLEMMSKLRALKWAAKELRSLSTLRKNQVLEKVAHLLEERQDDLLKVNEKDVAAVQKRMEGNPDPTVPAFVDRLTLSPQRISLMVESLRQIASLSDPVGEIVDEKQLKNDLRAKRIRAPLGVIFLIFEFSPRLVLETFGLAFKAGNALVLWGGSETARTTKVLYRIIEDALRCAGLSKNMVWGIQDSTLEIPEFLLKQQRWIDVVLPRGTTALTQYVVEQSQIPVIRNDRGICHIYVHEDADLTMASNVIINSKTQRPGLDHAMETLLVHESVAQEFLPQLHSRLLAHSVEWYACPTSFTILEGRHRVKPATPKSWDTEYLRLSFNCKIVDSLGAAVAHIDEYGTRHSEVILTRSQAIAEKFQFEVDAAVVYWNASTRFSDGFEMGLGGDLGMSTQKLHVRGPIGLRELTSVRWMMNGVGQVRG